MRQNQRPNNAARVAAARAVRQAGILAARKAGYTLIEIIVVVVIIATAAAVVIPQVIGTSDLQALSGARTLASDLEYARDLAITSGQSVTVTFDASANSYRLTNASGDMVHPITKAKPYRVAFATTPGLGQVDVLTASFNGNPAVVFDETGAPSGGGTVTLQAGPKAYHVQVSPATGKVTVVEVK